MLTKEMVHDAIWQKLIRFVPDPATGHGTMAQIGDDLLWFGGTTAEEEDPDEYLRNADWDEITEDIFSVLYSLRRAHDGRYARCDAYLTERLKDVQAYGFTVRTPKGKLVARPNGDDEYPGIALSYEALGEPGVYVEYDPKRDTIVTRVWDGSDPDDDPCCVIDLITGRRVPELQKQASEA